MSFICNTCNSKFANKRNLNRHQEKNCLVKKTITLTKKINYSVEIENHYENVETNAQVNMNSFQTHENMSQSQAINSNNNDSEILTILKSMKEEIRQLREEKQALININNTINVTYNLYFSPKSESNPSGISLYENLKNNKDWSDLKILDFAIQLINSPNEKLNWMLTDEFIDLFENNIPFDIKENELLINQNPVTGFTKTSINKANQLNENIVTDLYLAAMSAIDKKIIEEMDEGTEAELNPYVTQIYDNKKGPNACHSLEKFRQKVTKMNEWKKISEELKKLGELKTSFG